MKDSDTNQSLGPSDDVLQKYLSSEYELILNLIRNLKVYLDTKSDVSVFHGASLSTYNYLRLRKLDIEKSEKSETDKNRAYLELAEDVIAFKRLIENSKDEDELQFNKRNEIAKVENNANFPKKNLFEEAFEAYKKFNATQPKITDLHARQLEMTKAPMLKELDKYLILRGKRKDDGSYVAKQSLSFDKEITNKKLKIVQSLKTFINDTSNDQQSIKAKIEWAIEQNKELQNQKNKNSRVLHFFSRRFRRDQGELGKILESILNPGFFKTWKNKP